MEFLTWIVETINLYGAGVLGTLTALYIYFKFNKK